ncbi:hypothetical protein V6Z11_D04G063600 [Gossypium hirsutum]
MYPKTFKIILNNSILIFPFLTIILNYFKSLSISGAFLKAPLNPRKCLGFLRRFLKNAAKALSISGASLKTPLDPRKLTKRRRFGLGFLQRFPKNTAKSPKAHKTASFWLRLFAALSKKRS